MKGIVNLPALRPVTRRDPPEKRSPIAVVAALAPARAADLPPLRRKASWRGARVYTSYDIAAACYARAKRAPDDTIGRIVDVRL